MQKHLHKHTIRHDELWNKVNVPVSVVAERCRRLLSRAEHAPEVCEVEGGGLSTVVAVPVEVEHLFSNECSIDGVLTCPPSRSRA